MLQKPKKNEAYSIRTGYFRFVGIAPKYIEENYYFLQTGVLFFGLSFLYSIKTLSPIIQEMSLHSEHNDRKAEFTYVFPFTLNVYSKYDVPLLYTPFPWYLSVITPFIYTGCSFLLASRYDKYKVTPAPKNIIATNQLARDKNNPLIKERISFSIYYLALSVANLINK